MSDLRVEHLEPLTAGTPSVNPEQRRRDGGQHHDTQDRGRKARPGAEELAVALDGRTQLGARFEQGVDGQPLVRIIDKERGETVALLTPEELRALAEQTGLPPGMLVQLAS